MRDGVAVPLSHILAETSLTLPRTPCPRCGRSSALSGLDGGDCLACTMRTSAARLLGEGYYDLATDNAGIGYRLDSVRPARVS